MCLQVLTKDLEKQAAELQEEELPVATPVINIPHISARYRSQLGTAAVDTKWIWQYALHRLYNYEPLTPLRTLRASVFGRLVCVRGTVVRVSNIRPLCTRLAFKCLGCSHTLSLPLQHGKYTTPTKVRTEHTAYIIHHRYIISYVCVCVFSQCVQPDCRSRSFTAIRTSPLTHTVDWQIIKYAQGLGWWVMPSGWTVQIQ